MFTVNYDMVTTYNGIQKDCYLGKGQTVKLVERNTNKSSNVFGTFIKIDNDGKFDLLNCQVTEC